MVRFDIFSTMVVLALAISPGLAREIIDEGIEPAYQYDFAPSPYIDIDPVVEEIKFLDQCVHKLTEKCGEQIYFSIFKNETGISDECCTKLVSMGQCCHNKLVHKIINTPDPDLNLNVSDAWAKSGQIWDKCVAVAEAVSPSPSSEDCSSNYF